MRSLLTFPLRAVRLIALILTVAALQGCGIMAGATCETGLEIAHGSHPLDGRPVESARRNGLKVEDELNLAQLPTRCEWQGGKYWMSHAPGLNLQGKDGGGFVGSEFTYFGTFGMRIKQWGSR